MNQESDTSLLLANTSIVGIDGHPTDVPISFNCQLFSQAQVIGEIVICEKSELSPTVHKLLFTDRKEKIRVALANGAQFDAIPIYRKRTIGEDSYSLEISIILARQPAIVVNGENPLTELIFPILNFPSVLSSRSKRISDGKNIISVPDIRTEASGWCIEMTGVDNIRDVEKMLEQKRGLGITYTGRITQLNETEFEVNEAKKLLRALQIFLSFSCGRACGFPLVEGKDRGGLNSWVRWGSHYVHPWNYQHSLLRRYHFDKILQSLFPKFLALYKNDEWTKVLIRAIYYYLESNNVPMREVGIISAQITLELLSSQILRELGKGKKEREAAGKFINRALEALNITTNIPEHCECLRNMGDIHHWRNGLHALTDIRNDIVHSNGKFDDSPTLQSEAWTLGLWYIEMLLLKKLGYGGKYYNRFATRQNELESFPHVPWAKPEG